MEWTGGRNTRGLLRLRPVRGVIPARYVGKEANRIDDRGDGIVDQPDDYRTEYIDPTDRVWHDLVVPVLRTTPRSEVIRRSGLNRRTIERVILRGMYPHASHRAQLTELAITHAKPELRAAGVALARGTTAVLQQYLRATRLG